MLPESNSTAGVAKSQAVSGLGLSRARGGEPGGLGLAQLAFLTLAVHLGLG